MAMQVFTIGYEKSRLPNVIGALKDDGVQVLIDVRAVAASRRPGFSKTALAASLSEAGVAYVHLRALGTPKSGRDAARAGRTDEMREIFESHLTEPATQLALAEAVSIAADRPSALLCYEADPAGCHRCIVAARMAGFVVRHLHPARIGD